MHTCMLYKAEFLMLKHWFCRKYQYKKYIFNFIDHLQFIPMSVCIDMLWPGPKITTGIPIRCPRRGPSFTEPSVLSNRWGRYAKSDCMNIWRWILYYQVSCRNVRCISFTWVIFPIFCYQFHINEQDHAPCTTDPMFFRDEKE